MELTEKNLKGYSKKTKDYINRIITPIFDKVLKETNSNHRMVGSNPQIPKIIFLWQPHNYRLYFDFSKEKFNPKKPSNHTLQKFKSMVAIFNTAYTYTSLNYDSEHKYEKFMFCTIRVKKTQVEVTNHYHLKQWRKITAESVDEVDQRIDEVMNNLKDQSIKALKYFIDLHGGKSNFKVLNERCEHGIHGDDYLDKIPEDLIIHDTYIKKVYKRKVELKTATTVKNYISARAVGKITPQIASEINKLNQKQEIFNTSIDTYNISVNSLTEQMQLHLNVMQNINKTMSAIRNELKPLREKKANSWEVIDHLFEHPSERIKFNLMSESEKNKILFGKENI